MIETRIVNVVVTAFLNQKPDFEELRKCKEIFQDPEVYGGRVAYFKKEKMQGSVSIFTSGKMIGVGTKSEREAFNELETTVQFLAEKGYIKPVKISPKIRNIVVTADFKRSLNLRRLSDASKAIYEPKQFPGAILRLKSPYKTSILVFASGKVVVTGLRNENQIEPTMQKLKHLLELEE